MFDTQYGEETMKATREIDAMLVNLLTALKHKNPDEIVFANMKFIKELSMTQALPDINVSIHYNPMGLQVEILFPSTKALACPVCKKELVNEHNQICEGCCQRLNGGT